MLSVAVHKDIAEYQPKIVGKMTMRTLVSITGALSVSVLAGLYIYFVLGLNVSDCTYFIYAVSLPFWCVGFVKPCGMPFEQFAPLWLKANFTNDRIFYKPSMRLAGLLSESENSKQKGTTLTEFIAAQGRFTDSFDSIRQFSLRHVPTHPYSSNALSQKPLLTIAFSHFHISCHSLSGLSKSSICKQMLFRSASLLSAASASMISENDETSFSKTRFASSGSNTFTP